jgi:small conductance mechanosensitive channel
MDFNGLTQAAAATLMAAAWKIAGAAALWLVGRWLIRFAQRLVSAALARQGIDATLSRYLHTGLEVVLNVALIVAILGFFGVETTTFAALIAAGGVAIGVAWGPDNVLTIVGNNKVFSENIQNFSANPFRRVDLTATISQTVDHHTAIALLQDRLARIPNVLATPKPDVDVLQFTPAGPVLCVRPYCSNDNYWQVYFDTNRMIRETFTAAGFPAPMVAYAINGPAGAAQPEVDAT